MNNILSNIIITKTFRIERFYTRIDKGFIIELSFCKESRVENSVYFRQMPTRLTQKSLILKKEWKS